MPQIAGALPMLTKIAPLITQGVGTVSNVIRGNRVNEAQKAALQRQKELDQLIKNPALLAQKVQSMTQPLNQGLVQGVENQAQGGLAERGLGTSPQIANEVFAQALGPYQHQNQMEALRSVLQMYGIDESMLNTIIGAEGQPTDTSGLWGAMQKPPQQPWQNTNTSKIPTSTGGGPDVPVPGLEVPGGDPNQPSPFPGAGAGDGNFPGAEGLF
jgi:hypothetical protein